jgi:hypothetical protein
VNNIIQGFDREESKYFKGFYITDFNDFPKNECKRINLIPLTEENYEPWRLTTEAFKQTFKQSHITDKKAKYVLFEGMVALYKATLV